MQNSEQAGPAPKMGLCAHRLVKWAKFSDKTLWPSGLRQPVANGVGVSPREFESLRCLYFCLLLVHAKTVEVELSDSVLILVEFRRYIDNLLLRAYRNVNHRISDSGPMVRVLRCQRGDSGSIPGCCIQFFVF